MNWPIAVLELGTVVAVIVASAYLLAVLAGQLGATWRARMSVAREEAYRKLADEMGLAQVKIGEALTKAGADLSDMSKRVAALERMLKEAV